MKKHTTSIVLFLSANFFARLSSGFNYGSFGYVWNLVVAIIFLGYSAIYFWVVEVKNY